jgi:hypothetical protein
MIHKRFEECAWINSKVVVKEAFKDWKVVFHSKKKMLILSNQMSKIGH